MTRQGPTSFQAGRAPFAPACCESEFARARESPGHLRASAKAVAWMEKHKPDDEELKRFRAEAEELLGITDGE
jgi:hypothetical protein